MKNHFSVFVRALFLGVLTALALSSGPLYAQRNNDWMAQQQRQQDQQRQQQQQQQQRAYEQQQARAQEVQRQRQELQEQQRREMRAQERGRIQNEERQRLVNQQRADVQNQLRLQSQAQERDRQKQEQKQAQQAQQAQQRKQIPQSQQTSQDERRRMQQQGKLGSTQAVANKQSPAVSSGGVVRRPLTTGEIRRGFTGKVTNDGKALVKFQGRVVAVPASRVSALSSRLSAANSRSHQPWTSAKKAHVEAQMKALAKPVVSTDEKFSDQKEKLLWTTWAEYKKVVDKEKEYAEIGSRLYTRHAVERMQPSHLRGSGLGTTDPGNSQGKGKEPGRSFPPALVEDVIQNGNRRKVIVKGIERTIHSSGTAEIVTEQNGRIVVTVNPFRGRG